MPYIGNFLAANDRNGYLFEFAKSEVQDRRDKGGNDMSIVGQLFQTARSKSELYALSYRTNLMFPSANKDIQPISPFRS